MADSAQRDESPAAGTGGADHAIKIEQLLLSGLDHYFRGRLERAIDVWTRVLFLDRSDARARAYIDRARAAVAERVRESEALLHAGIAACDRGDVAEARALLTTAIARGGAHLADQTGQAPVPPRVPPPPLPVLSVPQLALERAKALVADGRYAEALGVLASVGLGDELRGDVDALRAAIQQEMLSRLPEMTAGAAAEYAGSPDTR